MNYIPADKLISQIKELRSESCISEADDYYEFAKTEIIEIITSLQQEEESIAERFARIVRKHISELPASFLSQFEGTYQEITGEKMYQGYND